MNEVCLADSSGKNAQDHESTVSTKLLFRNRSSKRVLETNRETNNEEQLIFSDKVCKPKFQNGPGALSRACHRHTSVELLLHLQDFP